MPQHLIDDLQRGIEAMRLDVPERTSAHLIEYVSLLNHWNQSFNLTAIRDPQEMVSKHLLDSLAVLPYLGAGDVLDVGSGAGLPGIPLALAKPEQHFTLVDTNGKKTRFLKQAKIVLGLDNIAVIHQRIEAYQPGKNADVIIARAYASVEDIIRTTAHLHAEQTRILVMQGKLDEQTGVPGYMVSAVHRLEVPGLEAERHLLEIVKC